MKHPIGFDKLKRVVLEANRPTVHALLCREVNFMKKSVFLFIFFWIFCLDNAYGEITILAVGDVMLGRFVEAKYNGTIEVDDQIKHLFNAADCVFGNLEAPFGNATKPITAKPINLIATKNSAKILKQLGFTVMTLANNHSMDFGLETVEETKRILESNGIASFGTGATIIEARSPYIYTVKGFKIGFIGYSAHVLSNGNKEHAFQGVAPLDAGLIVKDVTALKKSVNFIIVSLHWGREFFCLPAEEQINLAHKIIDAGADMILGHHPHVLQGIECYQGKLIAYSLGNFIFDQRDETTCQSIILRCTIQAAKISSVKVYPIVLEKYIPRMAKKDEAEKTYGKVSQLSRSINGIKEKNAWVLTMDR